MKMRQLLIIITSIVGLTATACSREQIPFVYKIDIPQGNIVDQEMVSRLEMGMDKPRVRYIMGTPMVVDVFHQDRWDYVYLRQPARGEREMRRITLHFENEQLVRISGDVRPSSETPAPTGRMRRAQNLEVPLDEDKGLLEGFIDKVGLGDDEEKEKRDRAAPEKEDNNN